MKIYTKTGDAGETGLYGGGRVGKDDPRIDAVGELDEANAALGAARAAGLETDLDEILASAQNALFDIGGEIATPPGANENAKKKSARVADAAVQLLEIAIDRLEERLPKQTHFILPGGHESAAALHLARTILRRSERRIVALHRTTPLRGEILRYVNRLSDLLFVMARTTNHRHGIPDVKWDPDAKLS